MNIKNFNYNNLIEPKEHTQLSNEQRNSYITHKENSLQNTNPTPKNQQPSYNQQQHIEADDDNYSNSNSNSNNNSNNNNDNDNDNSFIKKDDSINENEPEEQEQEQEDEIAQPLIEKVNQLDQVVLQGKKSEEEILNIRKNQIVIIKILVFVHNKSYFMLINAETKLGEAYLNFGCLELAITHLSMAEKRNQLLYQKQNNKERLYFQSYIYQLLGKCYLHQKQYEDALEYFNMAQEIQYDMKVPVFDSIQLIAQCHSEMKHYDIAIQEYSKALDIFHEYKQIVGEKEQTKFLENQSKIYIEQAKTYALKEDYENAIETQQKAIDNFISMQYNIEKLAEQYKILSIYQKEQNLSEDYIKTLNSILQLYKSVLGPCDIKVLKAQRKLSIEYLKQGNLKTALNSLYETEKLEEIMYGKYTSQIAQTQKIIGSVLVLLNHYQDAKRYLKLALHHYEINKDLNKKREIQAKIQFIRDLEYKQMHNDLIDDEEDSQINESSISGSKNHIYTDPFKEDIHLKINDQTLNNEYQNEKKQLLKQNHQEEEDDDQDLHSQMSHSRRKNGDQVELTPRTKYEILEDKITDYDLINIQNELSQEKEIESLIVKTQQLLKSTFLIKHAKVYASDINQNDDDQEDGPQLYTVDTQKNELVNYPSTGICGHVFDLGDFQFLQSIYNNNVHFNSQIDLQTELPIACFTCFTKKGEKMGVIQCLDPDQFRGTKSSKKKLLQKLMQFGMIFAENLKNFQASDI